MINRREVFRANLHPLYASRYDILCSLLDSKWQPCQGVRTFEAQDRLYKKRPKVTNARGGESAHNYGCATDWTIFDEKGIPTWPDKNDPVWEEYARACEKAGLRWGGSFSDYPHNQLPLSVSWKFIGKCYQEKGQEYALEMIQESIINA